MTNNDFVKLMTPYAQKAAAATNIPVGVILAQWGVESNNGNSDLFKRSGNAGGIKHTAHSIDYGATGMYADYRGDYNKFVQDYIRVMGLSYYKATRDAVSVSDTIRALGASPYAESAYGGGKTIVERYNQLGLARLDAGTAKDTKQISITVPNSSDNLVVGLAVIAAGVAMLKLLVK